MLGEVIGAVLPLFPGAFPVLLCAALATLSSICDTAAPSVSLEGKSLWIPQSLPVEPRTVLRAKASVQLIVSAVPLLLAGICAAVVVDASPAVKALLCVLPPVFALFSALFNTVIGVKMPQMNWTSEIQPIKQSGAVAIALFGGWGISLVLGGLYFVVGYRIGAALYLLIWTVLLTAVSLLLLRWLDTRGAKAFSQL